MSLSMMTLNFPKKMGLALIISTLMACSHTEHIDVQNDEGEAVMSLDYRDFQTAADEAVASLIQSGRLNKADGSRYILAISRIINDTMQRIDTDQLIKKIRVALLNSNKVLVTTAVSATQTAEDNMAMQVRKLRASDEFKQSTVAKKGQLIAPDLSLSGKILQRNIKIDSDEQQVEYYFQLSLSDINTGLAVWEGETFIGKRGDDTSVSW